MSVSVYDLAVLSDEVYNDEFDDKGEAHKLGWSRTESQLLTKSGFFAAKYERKEDVIVAYRGTDDKKDVLADAQMLPLLNACMINDTLETLLVCYGVHDSSDLEAIKGLLRWVLLAAQKAPDYINSVPTEQTSEALSVFDKFKPQCVTGHSLGGALAKVVSERRSVVAVAFNSPFMGNMRGTIPQTSILIANVNTKGDPLSLATRTAGNLSHGFDTKEVTVEDLKATPPKRPATYGYTRMPAGCEVEATEKNPLLGLACHLAQKKRIDQEREDLNGYKFELLLYLKEAMKHYHKMANLRKAIGNASNYRSPINPGFEGLF